jgi:hypothetical protein
MIDQGLKEEWNLRVTKNELNGFALATETFF